MNPLWLDATTSVLNDRQCVPLSVGHGNERRAARLACRPYLEAPGVVGRCYYALAALGEARLANAPGKAANVVPMPIERWPLRNWVEPAKAWFDQHHDPVTAQIPHAERCRYLLHAMLMVVENWAKAIGNPTERARRQTPALLATQWHEAAEEGVMNLLDAYDKNARFNARHPTKKAKLIAGLHWTGPRYDQRPHRDARWNHVPNRLADPKDHDTVVLCLFMHVLHAILGIPQPDLDRAKNADVDNRVDFYEALLRLLRNSHAGCCWSGAASRIADTLPKFALLAGPTASLSADGLWPALPESFHPYAGQSLLLTGEVRFFMRDPHFADELVAVYQLAEIVADAILDPLHQRRSPAVPGLQPADYAGPDGDMRTHARKELWPPAAIAHAQCCASYWANLMKGRFADRAHGLLPDVIGHTEWQPGLCALHFIDC